MMRVCFILLVATLFGSWSPAECQHVYFGNLHSHTEFSDGLGEPEEAFLHARMMGLDFLAITDHNHRWAGGGAGERRDGLMIATDHSLYVGPQDSAMIPAAERMTVDGEFVAIYGQEYSSISRGNHVNVFLAPAVIEAPNGAFDELLPWLDAHPDPNGLAPLVQFNHPTEFTDASEEYGADDFGSPVEWVRAFDPYVSLIEVINGPAMARVPENLPADDMQADFLHYLNLGFHLGPTANQDNHYRTWGDATEARTGVIANALTRGDLMDALRARHGTVNLLRPKRQLGGRGPEALSLPRPHSIL